MKPLQTQIRANGAARDGNWLLEACEQHRIWDRDPGSLWTGGIRRKKTWAQDCAPGS